MIVAIHQPNYLPWLGYFSKIVKSDVFIFLDDVQYSKNSYINRVRVMGPGGAKWLTVPVSYNFGDTIDMVRPARSDWSSSHLGSLHNYYRSSQCFDSVWPRIKDLYKTLPDTNLASINRQIIQEISAQLGLSCHFETSSKFSIEGQTSDDRLVALVTAVDPEGTYLSGRGGAKYQNDDKFRAAGLEIQYADYQHPQYDQGVSTFTEGLSILDPVFHLGWSGTADLILELSGL